MGLLCKKIIEIIIEHFGLDSVIKKGPCYKALKLPDDGRRVVILEDGMTFLFQHAAGNPPPSEFFRRLSAAEMEWLYECADGNESFRNREVTFVFFGDIKEWVPPRKSATEKKRDTSGGAQRDGAYPLLIADHVAANLIVVDNGVAFADRPDEVIHKVGALSLIRTRNLRKALFHYLKQKSQTDQELSKLDIVWSIDSSSSTHPSFREVPENKLGEAEVRCVFWARHLRKSHHVIMRTSDGDGICLACLHIGSGDDTNGIFALERGDHTLLAHSWGKHMRKSGWNPLAFTIACLIPGTDYVDKQQICPGVGDPFVFNVCKKMLRREEDVWNFLKTHSIARELVHTIYESGKKRVKITDDVLREGMDNVKWNFMYWYTLDYSLPDRRVHLQEPEAVAATVNAPSVPPPQIVVNPTEWLKERRKGKESYTRREEKGRVSRRQKSRLHGDGNDEPYKKQSHKRTKYEPKAPRPGNDFYERTRLKIEEEMRRGIVMPQSIRFRFL